jgi:hypothetical protein
MARFEAAGFDAARRIGVLDAGEPRIVVGVSD